MSKVSKLTTSQKASVSIFWNWIRENDPKIDSKFKQNLDFLRSSDNQAIIHERIMNSDYKMGTKRSHLNNLGVIIRDVLAPNTDASKKGKKPKNKPLDPGDGNVYIKEALQLLAAETQKKIEDDDKGVKGDEKNFLSYEQIIKRMREFEGIVKKDPTNRKNVMSLLILQLNVYQPPLRRTISTMTIIKDKKYDDGKNNFLYIKNKTEMWYIVNEDKVKNKKTDQNLKELPLYPNACRSVDQSLSLFPRSVLLTAFLNDKQCTQIGYDGYLKYIFKDLDWTFTQNNFRRAYITNFLASNPSVKKSNEIARLMRSSVQQLRETYNYRLTQSKTIIPLWDEKTGDPKENEEIQPIEQPKSIGKEQILKMLEDKIKNGFDLKKWGETYRPKHKAEKNQFNKKYYGKKGPELLRNKIISNLNRGQTKTPRPESVKTYNLKYDPKTKKWF